MPLLTVTSDPVPPNIINFPTLQHQSPTLEATIHILPQTWSSPVPLEHAGVPFRACFFQECEISATKVLSQIEEKEIARVVMLAVKLSDTVSYVPRGGFLNQFSFPCYPA